MNLILHLPPETEAKLKEQAAAIGKAPEELGAIVLEERLAEGFEPPPAPISPEEWIADIRKWAESHRHGVANADDSRDSIYEGCGE